MRETQGTNAAEVPGLRPHAPERLSYSVGLNLWPHSGSALQQTPAPSGDVLLLGHDLSLQRTRASLLERAGLRCYLAEGAEEVLCLAQNLFEVVVICHTLPVAEACQAVENLRLRFHGTAILRLARYLQAEEECFEHLLILPSPSEFLAMVQHLSLPAGCTA